MRRRPPSWQSEYLAGCYWLDDPDPCVRASADAIMKSGLPYPRYEKAADGKILFKDMWIGGTRFVVPSAIGNTMGYEAHHPSRHHGLMGSLPNFYPPGPSAEMAGRVSPSVFVRFSCSMDERYVASWGSGYRSNAEGIAAVTARFKSENVPPGTLRPTVEVILRQDIGMIEVLKDSGPREDGSRMQQAAYWPIGKEQKAPDGSVSEIACDGRNIPGYMNGRIFVTCRSTMKVTPNVTARISVYSPYIEHMPAVYGQVKSVLLTALEKGNAR
ncbi:MAG: hypothetical protein K0S46_1049 [Moraxellaceae bacterium]|nr:hypothetical protein [Moraxellaceae bacterium]